MSEAELYALAALAVFFCAFTACWLAERAAEAVEQAERESENERGDND